MAGSKGDADESTAEAPLPELAALLERRWGLTQDRSQSAAVQLRTLDEEIAARFERTVAPFVLDISGFTRITARRGLIHYLTLIHRMAALCGPVAIAHEGTVVKYSADNLFAYFPSTVHALKAAIAMRSTLDRENFEAPADFDIYISVGIGYGPTLIFDHDMWGRELILASKLGEDIAASREILLTEAAYETLPTDEYKTSSFPVTLGGDSYMTYRLESSVPPGDK